MPMGRMASLPAASFIMPRFISTLRQAAFECGYALALHGSLIKDLDLVAIPWTPDAVGADDLVLCLINRIGAILTSEDRSKPHGRMSFTVELARLPEMPAPGYIDLAVMPIIRLHT